jgi:hypothetical protein
MAIYLLNISVDIADKHPEHIPEDLSINDQESMVEVFVEHILGFENAIAEYDDPDTEQHNQKKLTKLELQLHEQLAHEIAMQHPSEKRLPYTSYSDRLTHRFAIIDSPPPKV